MGFRLILLLLASGVRFDYGIAMGAAQAVVRAQELKEAATRAAEMQQETRFDERRTAEGERGDPFQSTTDDRYPRQGYTRHESLERDSPNSIANRRSA